MTEIQIDKGARGAQQLGILLSVLVPNDDLDVRVRDLGDSWHLIVEGALPSRRENNAVQD